MFNFYNKHYIRVVDGIVIKGFSDAFEKPLETDICINEKGGRHFEIDGRINPHLINRNIDNFNRFNHVSRMMPKSFASSQYPGTHIYRYDTELRKATQEELAAEYEIIKSKEANE